MAHFLELVLIFIAGMLVISAVWWAVLQGYRGRIRLVGTQLGLARKELEVHEQRAAQLVAIAQRSLPPGRRPEIAREALPALDNALLDYAKELKQLHRRLVVNLHVINQLRKSEDQLSSRVIELEQMLIESPEYELRARFRALTSERDYFRNKLIELQQQVSPGQRDLASQFTTLVKHNEVLRAELKQARRLIQIMQRQIRMLQREGMESAGIAVRGLLQHDLPPGAFESLSDVPIDDPEEFTADEIDEVTPVPVPELARRVPDSELAPGPTVVPAVHPADGPLADLDELEPLPQPIGPFGHPEGQWPVPVEPSAPDTSRVEVTPTLADD